jgi:hypothetical protein
MLAVGRLTAGEKATENANRMQETTDSVSCAQKLIQPKRRMASAAVARLRRAGSPASVAIDGGSPGLAALPLPDVAAATRLPCCDMANGNTCH